MDSAPIQTRSVCPACGEALRLRSLDEQFCVSCGSPVRISWSYRRQISYIALVIVALIGFATYSHTSTGPWIIGLALFWLWIAFVLSLIIPATYERGQPQLRITFVASFLGVFVTLFTVEFIGFLTAFVLLGANPREVQEQLEFLSEPLRWFSPQFLITPDKSFLDVCGIMLGNSFFLGIPFVLCGKAIQYVMRRNRVVQLGIDHSVEDDE